MIAQGGKAISGASVGILMLDTHIPRIPGDVGNATTWPFPVHYKIVRGASPERVVLQNSDGLRDTFIEAALELVAGRWNFDNLWLSFFDAVKSESSCTGTCCCLFAYASSPHRSHTSQRKTCLGTYNFGQISNLRASTGSQCRLGNTSRRHATRLRVRIKNPE